MGEARPNVALPFPIAQAALALAAVLIARGFAYSLPGTFAGIDRQIGWVEVAGAYLTQLCALAFGVNAARTAVQALMSALPLALRVLGAAASMATVAVVVIAAGAAYQPGSLWLMSMALGVIGLGFAVAASSLPRRAQRGCALLLLLCCLSALLHLVARWLVLQEEAGVRIYEAAEWLATLGLLSELLAGGAGLYWLLAGPSPSPLPATHGAFAKLLLRPAVRWSTGALGFAVISALAFADGVSGWRLLLSRTLLMLRTHPDPRLPLSLSNLSELLALLVCALCLLPWPRPALQRAVIALLLLSRASADVPLGGVFALTGALALALDVIAHQTLIPLPKSAARPQIFGAP
jgi:hypothetical protein